MSDWNYQGQNERYFKIFSNEKGANRLHGVIKVTIAVWEDMAKRITAIEPHLTYTARLETCGNAEATMSWEMGGWANAQTAMDKTDEVAKIMLNALKTIGQLST